MSYENQVKTVSYSIEVAASRQRQLPVAIVAASRQRQLPVAIVAASVSCQSQSSPPAPVTSRQPPASAGIASYQPTAASRPPVDAGLQPLPPAGVTG